MTRDKSKIIAATNTKITEFNNFITLNSEDRELYDSYSKSIEDTINSYSIDESRIELLDGGLKNVFDLILACNNGVYAKVNGTMVIRDANYYRACLASELGWNKDNDLSIKYYDKIDQHYNPIKLGEMAEVFFSVVGARSKFIKHHPSKFDLAVDYIKYFSKLGKQVLVFNESNEGAKVLANMLELDNIECGAYVSGLPLREQYDAKGDIVIFKSGAKKGQIKYAGDTIQKRVMLSEFNSSRLNVIAFGKSLHKDVNLYNVEAIIFIGGGITTIKNIIYFSKAKVLLHFNDIPIVNITIGMTTDQTKFERRQYNTNNRIIDVDNIDKFAELIPNLKGW